MPHATLSPHLSREFRAEREAFGDNLCCEGPQRPDRLRRTMRLPPAAAALLRLRNGSTGLTGRAGSINRAGLTDSTCSTVGDEAAQVLGDRLRRPRPGPHAEGTGRTVCRLVDRRRVLRQRSYEG